MIEASLCIKNTDSIGQDIYKGRCRKCNQMLRDHYLPA